MERQSRLLIVEDDEGIRELLAEQLSDYNLEFAICQADAYDLLKSSQFELVVLDLRLPVRQKDLAAENQVGIDILDRIRRQELKKGSTQIPLPVVVITAHGDEEISTSVLTDHGANDYLKKPFKKETIRMKIERSLTGEGALVPRGTPRGATDIFLAFDDETKSVYFCSTCIPPLRGTHYRLLNALSEIFIKDRNNGCSPNNYCRLTGRELAERFSISEQALRKSVSQFYRDARELFHNHLERAIGDNDIVDNIRDRGGYRLNPNTIRILDLSEMPHTLVD